MSISGPTVNYRRPATIMTPTVDTFVGVNALQKPRFLIRRSPADQKLVQIEWLAYPGLRAEAREAGYWLAPTGLPLRVEIAYRRIHLVGGTADRGCPVSAHRYRVESLRYIICVRAVGMRPPKRSVSRLRPTVVLVVRPAFWASRWTGLRRIRTSAEHCVGSDSFGVEHLFRCS